VTVAFVDTETTGLDPERHEIWEVGLILPDGSEHSWQLPVDLSRADSIALNVGQFHERRQLQGLGFVSPAELSEWCSRFVALTRGLHLAGCVVSFDAERLAKLLRANGECPMWHYHLIDVEALAAGYVSAKCEGEGWDGTKGTVRVDRQDGSVNNIDGRPPWKSVDLSLAVGVNPEDFEKHTAMGDARWAKAIYEAVMGS
jgi:hypothetical protein